jgi:hypothetical protein
LDCAAWRRRKGRNGGGERGDWRGFYRRVDVEEGARVLGRIAIGWPG